MNKILGVIVLSLMVFMPIMACKSLSFDGTPPVQGTELVVTTQDQLVEMPLPSPEVTVVNPEIVPDEVESALGANTTNPVVVTLKRNVQPTSTKSIPLEGVDLSTEEGWLDFLGNPAIGGILRGLLGGIEGVAPILIGLEGILTLLSSRKRQHYAQAAKSMVQLKPGEAVKSVTKALGALHTES